MPSSLRGLGAPASAPLRWQRGVLVVAQWVKNPTSVREDTGSIPGLI